MVDVTTVGKRGILPGNALNPLRDSKLVLFNCARSNKYSAHVSVLINFFYRKTNTKFTPGGIHTCFDYWADTLHAGTWVLNIIKNGYEVPLKSISPEAEFQNNASVRENLEITQQLVKDYLEQRVLRIVHQKPKCFKRGWWKNQT